MKSIVEILKLTKKYNSLLILITFLSILLVITDLLEPYLLSRMVEMLSQGRNILTLIIGYVCLLILGKLLENVHGFIVSLFNMKAVEIFRYKATQWILQRRMYGYLPFNGGGIVSRLTSDVDAVSQLLASPLNGLIPEVLSGIGALGMLAYIDWKIMLLTLIVLPFYYFITKRVNNLSKSNAKKKRETYSGMTSYFMDFVKNFPVYVCYDGRLQEEKYSTQFGKDLTHIGKKQNINMARYWMEITILRSCVILAALLILKGRIVEGDLGAGVIIIVMSYLQKVFAPIIQLSRYANQISQAGVAVHRVFELKPKEVDYIGDFTENQIEEVEQLSIKNLTVSYQNDGKKVIDNISFDIKKNCMICLYGASGSGKSTLLHVLCGLVPINSGKIYVNGIDYTEKMLQLVLDRKIRMVFQESYLFDRSIDENIRYGCGKELNYEEFMNEIGRKLGLNFFLSNRQRTIQNGLNGETISGGERRRIALMRGLNQKANIYLLDEPTSELDEDNARKVISIINELKKEAIVIVSTHDSKMLEFADSIIKCD